jgi:serine/threonine protein kinase
VGIRLDGKYDVHSVVAEGGFGVVYRATHRTLQKPVAIKVLKTPPSLPDSSRKEFIDKFVFEARTIARLEHPGIVRILDFGGGLLPSGGAAPWIVLEWIDGQPLDAVLDSRRGRGGLAPTDALALLRPVFEALAVAHDEGVAHRDLKPANVMLARTRQGIEPKLLDFGIAKEMANDEAFPSGATATRTVLRAFTLAYASPEQLGGTRTGPWTDVHALALLLVEALTDFPPLNGEDNTTLTIDALSPVRPTPAKCGLDVGSWEPVIARALALRPTERFQNAREFLAALDSSLPARAEWRDAALGTTPSVDHAAVTTPRVSVAPYVAPAARSLNLWIALVLIVAIGAVALAFILVRHRGQPAFAHVIPTTPVALPTPPTVTPSRPAVAVTPPTIPRQVPVVAPSPGTAPAAQRTLPVRPAPTRSPASPLPPRPAPRERVPVE